MPWPLSSPLLSGSECNWSTFKPLRTAFKDRLAASIFLGAKKRHRRCTSSRWPKALPLAFYIRSNSFLQIDGLLSHCAPYPALGGVFPGSCVDPQLFYYLLNIKTRLNWSCGPIFKLKGWQWKLRSLQKHWAPCYCQKTRKKWASRTFAHEVFNMN